MNETYTILTIIVFAIAALIGLALLATFDISGAARQRREARQIRKVRRVIDRYTPSVILTENEKKSVVLDYLKENKMFCSNKERL